MTDLPPHLASHSYTAKKTVAKGFLDLALLLANTSQLRSVLEVPFELRTWTFWPLVVMLGLTLLLHLVTGIIMYVMETILADSEEEERRAKTLNNVSIGLIATIALLNTFITGFGISFTEDISE
ncbi:ninjurin-1-like [Haliotis rubra]|uniref:ninjurin-1-like n=1 Tax=Haliotis rubra TaxID=36100 RepID=UPI001EE5F0CC|nr:ninjurin-1-like [Haliotis rubra]